MSNIVIYFLFINYITLFVMGQDRYNLIVAHLKPRFKILHLLSLLGGGPSILLVLFFWRHPTTKIPFIISAWDCKYLILFSLLVMVIQCRVLI